MADLHQQGKVNPISAMTNIIQINGEKVVVNAQEILTRIAGIINTSSDMAGYLKYELVSQPPSLFDNVSMRKANKASLAKVLASEAKSTEKNYDAYVGMVVICFILSLGVSFHIWTDVYNTLNM